MDDEYPLTRGIDYPRTTGEFDARSATEADCREYLAGLRWAEGFECPKCGVREKPWITSRRYRHCSRCGAEIAVTSGTLFQGTRTSLRDILGAIWLIIGRRNGTSARDLQSILGLRSYQTAWTLLHKIRRAMGAAERHPLRDDVEVQPALLGTPELDGHDREASDKMMIAVAAERRGRKVGRIRLRRIIDTSGETLREFVTDTVTPGSLVRLAGWRDDFGLDRLGYRCKKRKLKPSGASVYKLSPRVQEIVLRLVQELRETHKNGFQQRYMDAYLDEFTFRFNRRAHRTHGLLFYRLMQQAATLKPAPYRSIVGDANRAAVGR